MIDRSEVDFEDFLAFLDLEHRLGLAGSDTWSRAGNETQVIVKQLIGQILLERSPKGDELPDFYYEFASQLEPYDYVLTFNYDTILERALEHVGKPYRLFPDRFSKIGETAATVSDEGRDEVVLLKLHGSIDWFDRTSYTDLERIHRSKGLSPPSHDAVFSPQSGVSVEPLVEGPRPDDDPLQSVFRVVDGLDEVYAQPFFIGGVPFLLTPSRFKMLYADQFSTYWWGMGQAGGYSLGIVIIGYSLPSHDDYVKQVLFRLVHNYQESWWDQEFPGGRRKEKVILVDLQTSKQGKKSLLDRYGFLDHRKSEFVWTGFNGSAVDLIRNGASAT